MQAIAGERQLWCEVIQQAWIDLFAPPPQSKWRQDHINWEQAKRDAELFLLKRKGDWARSRETICSVVGVDPDALRESAERAIAERKKTCEATNKHTLPRRAIL
jgi:hypothetical protein